MKGLWLLLCVVLPSVGQAEVISSYDSPETLVEDYDGAMSRVTFPEELRFNLAVYYSCRAREKGRIDVCDGLDSHLPATHENLPTCRRLFHQAHMIEDAVGGSGKLESCIELARISEEGLPDADTREEAADFCRKLGSLYEEGRPEDVCDFMFSQDGAYGENPYTGKPISRSDCIEENAFLAGEPTKCDVIVEGQGREHCRSKAVLVRRVKDKNSGFQTDAPGCAALAETTIKRYEALRRPRRGFGTPESIAARLPWPGKGAMSTRALDLSLIEYFVCVAYQQGSNAPCENIDRRLPPMNEDLVICKALYQEGRMLKELAEGSGKTVDCELDDRIWSGAESDEEEADSAELCRKSIPYLVRGDLEGYCKMVVDSSDDDGDGRSSMEECRLEYIYFTGDRERCSLTPFNFGRQERCRYKADLLKAVREKKPNLVKNNFYAPLLSPGGSCDGLKGRVLEEYAAREGDAQEDEEGEQATWDRRYATKEYIYGKDPVPFLKNNIGLLPRGRVLDLAAGEGRNAVFFAQNGFEVDAVDISAVGLKKAEALAVENGVTINTIVADLEQYDLGVARYDVIANFYFLLRSLTPKIKRALKPGGVVIYETATVGELDFPELKEVGKRGLEPEEEFLLKRGELREMFADFEILHYSEGNNRGADASLIARKRIGAAK